MTLRHALTRLSRVSLAVIILGLAIAWLLGTPQTSAGAETALPNAIDAAPVKARFDLTRQPAHGVKILRLASTIPDANGILIRTEIMLPPYSQGCYFSADVAKGLAFPEGGNRCQPWVFKSLKSLFGPGYPTKPGFEMPGRRKGGMFLILQLEKDGYLALVPIGGPRTLSWFNVAPDGRLLLDLGTLGTRPVSGDAPLLAWARSANVYEACRAAWAKAVACPPVAGRTALREAKAYPEVFKYLGWCSWEEYKKTISEPILVNAVRGVRDSGLPIRYVLIDDGHLAEAPPGLRLTSFRPNAKFPHGWDPILALRDPDHIRWMGVWFAFSGSWASLAERNDFGPAVNAALAKTPHGALIPRNDPAAARAYYDAFAGAIRSQGFDFLKIDVQAKNLDLYRGIDNAVQASANCSQALEAATHRKMQGLINCMAHNSSCVFNTRYSAVTRCSMDYGAGNLGKAKNHLHQSFSNMIWLGQTVWGDHDMFHSSDPVSGRMMAVSKALSGGPIYLSDNPAKFVPDYIRPLCYRDGTLLRPLAPGASLPESIFVDPFHQSVAYRAVAPLAGGAAAIVAYNLLATTASQPIEASVSAADYPAASGMIQPAAAPWKVPAGGLLVYDWYAGTAAKLDRPYVFKLKDFSDRLLLLCPIREGWAVIGRADKYLAPAAVETVAASERELKIKMVESGPLTLWSASGAPRVEGLTFKDCGGGLWRAEMPVGRAGLRLTIVR